MATLPFDNAIYLRHQYMVQKMAESFQRTTGVDSYELESAAWDKFAYARRYFPDDGSVNEKTFIRQIAKTAMIDYSNRAKNRNVPTTSLDAMLDTSEDNVNQASGSVIVNNLSVRDDHILADLSVTLSFEALELCRAIVDENIQNKSDCVAWGKAKGLTRTKVDFLLFETSLALQGKKMQRS